jgi:hypothetical protein
MTLTLEQRVAEHHAEWPKSCVATDGSWLFGVMIVGNDYKNKVGYYGEFPPRFLQRLLSLFPDIRDDATKSILHVFAGTVSDVNHSRAHVVRVEANPKLKAEVHGNAEELSEVLVDYAEHDGFGIAPPFDLVIADPPYSRDDAEKYGYPYPNKKKVIEEIAKVTRRGGFLCWLDVQTPIFTKKTWRMMGTIGLWTGTNRRFRLLTIWERV